jgi:hypothetical protein
MAPCIQRRIADPDAALLTTDFLLNDAESCSPKHNGCVEFFTTEVMRLLIFIRAMAS